MHNVYVDDAVYRNRYVLGVLINLSHTHNRFTALLENVRDHPGEQVPER